MPEYRNPFDVVVVGGGAAGIAASRRLIGIGPAGSLLSIMAKKPMPIGDARHVCVGNLMHRPIHGKHR
jgi:succinate dehydrogenase/fumarate reductase flavoprotein subunit